MEHLIQKYRSRKNHLATMEPIKNIKIQLQTEDEKQLFELFMGDVGAAYQNGNSIRSAYQDGKRFYYIGSDLFVDVSDSQSDFDNDTKYDEVSFKYILDFSNQLYWMNKHERIRCRNYFPFPRIKKNDYIEVDGDVIGMFLCEGVNSKYATLEFRGSTYHIDRDGYVLNTEDKSRNIGRAITIRRPCIQDRRRHESGIIIWHSKWECNCEVCGFNNYKQSSRQSKQNRTGRVGIAQ